MPDDGANKAPRGLKAWLQHAFAVDKYDESSLNDDEKDILDRLAIQIVKKQMATPAMMLIESHRHMNFLGSQLLVMAEPALDLAQPMLNPILKKFGMYIPVEEIPKLQEALEKRYSIEYLMQRLEHHSAQDVQKSSQPESAAAGIPEMEANEDAGDRQKAD